MQTESILTPTDSSTGANLSDLETNNESINNLTTVNKNCVDSISAHTHLNPQQTVNVDEVNNSHQLPTTFWSTTLARKAPHLLLVRSIMTVHCFTYTH